MDIGTGVSIGNFFINLISKCKGQFKNIRLWIQKKICPNLYKENQSLKEQVKRIQDMQYDDSMNVYWNLSNGEKEGPYCPRCMEKEKHYAHLRRFGYDLKCNVCDYVVGDKNIEMNQRERSFFD